MVSTRSEKISFGIALAFHAMLILLLVISLEKTIVIPAAESDPNKPIIDAVMVNTKTLQAEVARLEAIEAKKKAQEQAHQQELIRKEMEAKQKREKEEALAQELQKKNEQLKKEAEQQRLALQKQTEEREKKLKAHQEELKKIQKEKEAALASKKKIEAERKAVENKVEDIKKNPDENAEQQQANIRMKQDEITRYATMMRNKINQNWRQPIGLSIAGFTCKVEVRLLPTGEVIDAVVIQTSGSVEFDRSAELAVRKASPLPMPADPNIAQTFYLFSFTFRPEAV